MQLHIEPLPPSEAAKESIKGVFFFIYQQLLVTSALNITNNINKELSWHAMIIEPGIIIHVFLYCSAHYSENFQLSLI